MPIHILQWSISKMKHLKDHIRVTFFLSNLIFLSNIYFLFSFHSFSYINEFLPTLKIFSYTFLHTGPASPATIKIESDSDSDDVAVEKSSPSCFYVCSAKGCTSTSMKTKLHRFPKSLALAEVRMIHLCSTAPPERKSALVAFSKTVNLI